MTEHSLLIVKLQDKHKIPITIELFVFFHFGHISGEDAMVVDSFHTAVQYRFHYLHGNANSWPSHSTFKQGQRDQIPPDKECEGVYILPNSKMCL